MNDIKNKIVFFPMYSLVMDISCMLTCSIFSYFAYKHLIFRFILLTNFNAQFSLFINNTFVTLLSSTCFEH